MDWKSYTILYEDYDSLIRLQEVFKAHEGLSHLEGYPPFTVRQLPTEDDDYRYGQGLTLTLPHHTLVISVVLFITLIEVNLTMLKRASK